MINWHRDVSCMIVVYITCICRVHESMSKYQFIIYCMHTWSEINLYNTVITVYNRNYIQTAKDSEAVSEEKKTASAKDSEAVSEEKKTAYIDVQCY